MRMCRSSPYQTKWQFKDDFSWNKGRHSFKGGLRLRGLPNLGGFFQTPSTLNVTFWIDDPFHILSNTAKYPQGFSTPGADPVDDSVFGQLLLCQR